MQKLMYATGTEALRVMLASLVALVPGILAAPNQEAALALSVAAACTIISVGLRSFQVIATFVTWASLVKNKAIAAWMDAFTRAALASGFVFAIGWFAAPDWATWHSAALGATIGALAAGARALQGLASPGETPAPAVGIGSPAV